MASEVSAIVKRDGKLGYAKDPISSGKTWENFVPAGHFRVPECGGIVLRAAAAQR